ncbi:chromogranin-A isoform X3 [Colossoma macropomum]|uniref:chromogranin-A isoform X3 n=1 Tax=Colossoma macropomum TaxID=42526 RepID=UPI00186544DB|nr:chromogranin-A isoform X3 [Colossoma macropomum]
MISRGWVVFVVLVKCVFSVPVSTTHMDNEDVQVMKCIVEVLADALSKPRSIPVSQQCLQTLRTDDRLVTVLRHRNFLQELQDIAVEGANERTEKRMKDGVDYVSNNSEDSEATTADRSMLVAMERPGEEREEKRGEEEERDRENEEREQKAQEHNEISSQERRNEGEEDSDAMNEEQERKRAVMKKGANKDEDEKRSSLEEEEDETAGAGEHSEVKKSAEEEESQEEQETVEKRREGPGQLGEEEKAKAGMKHWSRTRQLAHRRAEMGAYDQQEAPHHSKEVPGQGEGEVWKSPEEQELQMMARRDPEDRREEEGSASKKTEDAEIESLAAIESELENVAQKLHELRRG